MEREREREREKERERVGRDTDQGRSTVEGAEGEERAGERRGGGGCTGILLLRYIHTARVAT
jgi:hypothetical protein